MQVDAEYGLHASAKSGLVDFDQRVEVGHVGDANGGHAEFDAAVDEWLDADEAVDEGVFGVDAEMDEFGHGREFNAGGLV
ncbi:hypothetical protein GCM10027297_35510 [Parahaliea aestuarii]